MIHEAPILLLLANHAGAVIAVMVHLLAIVRTLSVGHEPSLTQIELGRYDAVALLLPRY